MTWYWFVGVAVLLALVVFGYSQRSLLKTVLLILQVQPYEQPGGGAGSILVIGDSTGYGTGASKSSESVIGRLGNDYTWYRIENNSRNGRTISGAITEAKKVASRYSIIVLQIGANDLLQKRTVPETLKDMNTLIDLVIPKADHVVVISSGNIGAVTRFTDDEASYYEQVSREFTNQMIQLAQNYQTVSFVPLFDEPADDPFVAEPARYLAIDGLHPSTEGYGIWYAKAAPYFARIMK